MITDWYLEITDSQLEITDCQFEILEGGGKGGAVGIVCFWCCNKRPRTIVENLLPFILFFIFFYTAKLYFDF